jgi:hypothetical protein
MITENKRWMTYTYFNRSPSPDIHTTHLFSFAKQARRGMVCVPFPTITVDLDKEDFVNHWSASAKTKIKKAEQRAFAIERGSFLLKDVLKLFMLTAKRKGLRGYTEEDFTYFSDTAVSGVYDGEVLLCGHVWVIDQVEKRALLYVNAALRSADASSVGRAHYFLLWQDGLFLRQKGIRTMDLMGYDPETKDPALKGVYTWKAGTHGTTEILYHYYPFWFYVLRKFRNMLPL